MSFNWVCLEDVLFDQDKVYRSYLEIEPELAERMQTFTFGGGNKYDFYSPMKNGKEWLYELTIKHQPKTGQILLESGDLLLGKRYLGNKYFSGDMAKKYNLSLLQEINGMVIEIFRDFGTCNPSDQNFMLNSKERIYGLPTEIREAYYNRFLGMRILPEPVPWIGSYILPRSLNDWTFIDQYLSSISQKKHWLSFFDSMFPDIVPSNKKDPIYFNFAMPLAWYGSKKEADVFFVKPESEERVLYYIRDHKLTNLMKVDHPIEAYDGYCAHMLSRNEGRFDFMPYVSPIFQAEAEVYSLRVEVQKKQDKAERAKLPKKENPYPLLKTDGYELRKFTQKNNQSLFEPDPNFPDDESRCNLEPGRYVKLHFLYQDPDRKGLLIDKLWLRVERLHEDMYYIGIADAGGCLGKIKEGDVVNFHPFHVMEIFTENK